MDKEAVKEKLTEIFRSVFDNPEIELFDEMTSSDVVGWDSFSHINLISTIEMELDIEFTRSETFGFKTVGELIDSVHKKLV